MASEGMHDQLSGHGLDPTDELLLPRHKSMVAQYGTSPEGQRELRLFYGAKEITFAEPELFGFGETLRQKARFVAGEAASWGDETSWPRIRGLLEQLVSEGVLVRSEGQPPPPPATSAERERPSPLPPATLDRPRTWHECEDITRELTGRALEMGHLELMIPIFRVAHMALDADGRQVGESNVFPKAMRLDIPTQWRACTYPGTRHQDDRPMNLSALKAMRASWGSMMAVLLEVRRAYLTRYPDARQGWTVGHLERLATAVLALPTWQLMRAHRPVGPSELHPVLSSVFRVTDGLRMTMHQMLFVPIGEPTLSPDTPMTSAEIFAYAERNYSFHSEHGVCAGPQIMIEEFLSVLVDGAMPKGGLPRRLDRDLEAALQDIDAAMDYGLLGLRAYAVIFSAWPAMVRAYEGMAALVADWRETGDPRAARLEERLADNLERVRLAGYLGEEAQRADRDAVYADMFARCGEGVGAEDRALRDLLAPRRLAQGEALEAQLRQALDAGLPGAPAWLTEGLSAEVAEFALRIQSILRLARQAQAHVNRRLGRPQPNSVFDSRDLDLHNRLQGPSDRRPAYLFDEIADLFGIEIVVTPHRVRVATAPQAA